MPRTITFNWIDWIILATALISILRGARWGVLAALGDLAALIATFLAAAMLYAPAAAWARPQMPSALSRGWAEFIAFVIIWVGLYIPLGWVARRSLSQGAAVPAARLLGGALGGVRGLVLATAALILMLASPFRQTIAADVPRSWVAPSLLWAGDRVQTALLPALPVRVPRIGPGGRRF